MKKVLITLFIFILLLTGCSKNDSFDVVKKFNDDVNSSKSYEIIAKMKIISDEEEFRYNLDVLYMDDDYYNVSLINSDNNHKQIILKNDEGVYVITPSLNKSFKFESSWPNNSSQSYLLKSLQSDINKDNKLKLETLKDGYSLRVSINYPNNEELKYEKIYFDKNIKLKKVVVYDNENKERIVTDFIKIDYKKQNSENDFKLENYIDETKIEEKCEKENCDETTINILDDIIYPLYLPGNTYLTSSEKIENEGNNRVILTFAGDKNFTIVEEAIKPSNEFEIKPVYGDPVFINDIIGVMEDNSIKWDKGSVSYYLTSNNLSLSELNMVAASMNKAKSVAGSK